MFGKGNEMETLVNKRNWEKINKKLEKASAEEKIQLAEACTSCLDEDSSYTCINLLTDSDLNVVLAAAKTLGEIGHDNAKTHLQILLSRIPESDTEKQTIVRDAIGKINKAKRR